MGWPVILTPQSQNDLREIVTFIARDNPERARTFGNLLVDRALSVGPHPEKGRVVPELDDPAVREIVAHTASFTSWSTTRMPSSSFASGTERVERRRSRPTSPREHARWNQAVARLASANSRTASACARVTPGNHSRNWSTVAPSSRFSNNVFTGTRVPRKSHAPLTFSGDRSTAVHAVQSSMLESVIACAFPATEQAPAVELKGNGGPSFTL